MGGRARTLPEGYRAVDAIRFYAQFAGGTRIESDLTYAAARSQNAAMRGPRRHTWSSGRDQSRLQPFGGEHTESPHQVREAVPGRD